jgi:outer membrane protein, heavy metal efflux system
VKFRYLLIIIFFFNPPLFAQEGLDFVSLQDALLQENPRLKAMESEAEMVRHKIVQSSSLDDPRLKLGVNNLPADSFSFDKEDMTSKEIGVSQVIPLWGKRSTKGLIMTLEYQKALERVRLERLNTLHILRKNLYELIEVRASKEIFNQIKEDLKMVVESETALSKTGMGSLEGVINANIETLMTDEEIIILDQKESELLQKNRYLVGKNVEVNIKDINPEVVEMDMEAIRQCIDDNPAVKILKYEKQISGEQIKLKKLEYLPDMEIGASYMQRENGAMEKRADMVSGMVSFNIPLRLAAKDAMVQEMNEKCQSAGSALQDKRKELETRAESLFFKMNKWKKIIVFYRDRLMPQAEFSLKSALASYRTDGGLVSVIDKERQLLTYRRKLAMAERQYRSSYSGIASLMGKEVLR